MDLWAVGVGPGVAVSSSPLLPGKPHKPGASLPLVSSLYSPAEVEGNEGFPPPPEKDLE